MEFPTKYINPLKKQGKLDSSLDTLADILLSRADSNQFDLLDKFCQSYLRSAKELGSAGKRLRVAVASLIFEHGILRNSSVEAQWDIIVVYGAQNFTRVVSYLDSLPEFFHPKMKRLLLVVPADKQSVAILFNSSFVDIISHDWMVQLKAQNPEVHLVAHHYNTTEDVKQLRSLFPQLSISRASRLLRNSSLERAAQALVEDSDAGKEHEKKTFQKLDSNEKIKITYTSDYEKTLQLANALLDDDPDDDDDPEIRIFDSQVGDEERPEQRETATPQPPKKGNEDPQSQSKSGQPKGQQKGQPRGQSKGHPRDPKGTKGSKDFKSGFGHSVD